MRRFHHNTAEMLVPHVFGSMTKAKSTTAGIGNKKKWNEETFLAELIQQKPDCVEPAKKILTWAKECKDIDRLWWGEGLKTGYFVPIGRNSSKELQLFAVSTTGTLEVYFYWYKFRAPFESEEKRLDFLNRLNNIRGINIPNDGIHKRPNFSLSAVNDPQVLKELLEAFEWLLQEFKSV